MKLPEGYVLESVLSPGPAAIVALARRGGGRCVVKAIALERARPMLEAEEALLRALRRAGVAVPEVIDAWPGGFAMTQLRLSTLHHLRPVAPGSPVSWSAVARRAFGTLADVHAAKDEAGIPLGVVHGDVSPDNVYVAGDGSEGAIGDFGLARWRGGGPAPGGSFRGTLTYAAPEAARSERFDGRADDFSLAASLLHVATGVPLRPAPASEAAALVAAGTDPFDASHPWRTLAPKLFNFTVAEALLACLAFDARDRPRETPRPC